jgi:hypothetical protein
MLLMVAVCFVVLAACSDGDSPALDGDQAEDGDVDGDSDGDDPDGDETDGDETDGDSDGDISTDGDSEGEDEPTVFGTPRDGRLYAAAAVGVITPSAENHPCPLYMGGTGSGRLAEGVHDDLEARVLLLAQDDAYAVLVTLDLVGWVVSDADKVWDALAEQGIAREHVLVHTTHTHAAPDTLGVYGPEFNETGRCAEYVLFLVDTVKALVNEARPQMQAVTLFATETSVDAEGAPLPNLMNDIRLPFVTNDHMTLARLDNDEGQTVATVVNWNCHPETLIEMNRYSADFPRWTRKKIEDTLGGTALYFSGTVGGMMTSLGLSVPERTQDGEPVLDNAQPVYVAGDGEGDNERKAWSLGYIVGETALAALENAEEMSGPLAVEMETVVLSLDNLVFVVGFQMGVLEPWDEMYDAPECGIGGCIPQPVHYLHFGKLHILTIPGELFPELSVGREASNHDWEGDWGVKDYPAISGYRAKLPEGHLLMEFGLTGGEIGYIIPESDYLPSEHPGNYEEYFTIAQSTAATLKAAYETMLEKLE